MSWYKDLSISKKLVSGFVMVAAIAALVGVVGVVQLRSIGEADTKLYEKITVPLEEAGEISTLFQRLRVNLRDFVYFDQTRAERQKRKERIDGIRNELAKTAASYEKTIFTEDGRRKFQRMEDARKAYSVVIDRVIELGLKDATHDMDVLLAGDAEKADRAEMEVIERMLRLKTDYAKAHPDAVQIEAVEDLATIATAFQRLRVNTRELRLAETKERSALILSRIQNHRETIRKMSEAYEHTLMTDEGKRLYAEFLAAAKVFNPLLDRVIEMAATREREAILALLNGEGAKLADEFHKAIDEMVSAKVSLARETAESNSALATHSTQLMIGFVVAGALLAVLFGILISRMIARALAQGVMVAEKIAGGDLNVSIVVESKDETGQLMRAMQHMHAKLTEIVGNVRVGSDAIASAATQISQGNADLSQRTEEQASSLEETASSMEELTSTVKQNADNAQQANQLAAQARKEAEQGGGVARQAVAAMGEISASSRKIADIIGVIDEIAFQTNLLALNAAVEAARAGEQGRGFAVVAGEVRNLAQRSADSAKQIKELITASVSKVEEGSRYVDATGQALEVIMLAVKKVTDVMAEIAAASHEQSSGIEQVNRAVMQMDEVTQQNAALVEEAASAAKSMEDQASQLREMMGFFKMSGANAGAVAQAGAARPPSQTTVHQPVHPARAAAGRGAPAPRRPAAPKPAPGRSAPKPAHKPEPPARAENSEEEWEEF